MKTNETMALALIGAAACSFFFGLGQHEVLAAPIANCVQSCCEPVYGWWSGGTVQNPQQCATAQVTGKKFPFGAGDNTNQAIINLWVGAPTPGGCKLVPSGMYDQWAWPQNTASCQNKDGTWPNPQSVTPGGNPGQKPSIANSNRNVCGT